MPETNAGQPPQVSEAEPFRAAGSLDGVVIGVLLGITEDGTPLVAFPGNPEETALKGRATAKLRNQDIGGEVALLFEGGDPRLPLVIGMVQRLDRQTDKTPSFTADLDGERILLSAAKEIVLSCGKASITLTRSGKILIRGNYLLSRSSGVNRVKGAVVHIN